MSIEHFIVDPDNACNGRRVVLDVSQTIFEDQIDIN